jgi:hypothetical protein
VGLILVISSLVANLVIAMCVWRLFRDDRPGLRSVLRDEQRARDRRLAIISLLALAVVAMMVFVVVIQW